MAIVVAENLKKSYRLGKNNFVHALQGASLAIEPGEFVAIMGPSGSGKSTLLHMLGCLDDPDNGRVFLSGREVTKLRPSELTRIRARELGFIFQGFNLIPALTAIENVMLAAEYAGVNGRAKSERAEKMLDRVGLSERVRHLPSELSGGEQQRVAIARALVNEPAIILADEPTGDLDSTTSAEIIGIMRDLNRAMGRTFILVTHDHEVGSKCDRIIRMRDGVVDEAAG
ncbi:MAG: ABC transporter ATP-binding protein [Actinobacteria bacterium]|nr:ABC transporter ATP-binding protein [Actinomycetota bacterium]